ncbi:Eco57I restriction-modification methylase domain-containing protein [Streptomyces sp. NPDC048282]|uniref:Eco57I restriction-modification methylase domain-containing protein n=1 Tax=Streptomyces sp. NPDC048282 TaxID=3365528 RepID=UPI003715207D
MSLAKTIVTDSVLTVGGLLPPDTLMRVRDGKDIPGAQPSDYGLFAANDTVRDAAERSWAYLKGVWTAYQDALAKEGADKSEAIAAVGLTVERWLLPLFEQLGYGRLPDGPAEGLPSADGEKRFAVSHVWQGVPVHLTGWNVQLDGRGAIPQPLVQEYLNRSGEKALWGLVSNGRLVRLLRDSTSMVGSAYVEFDLEGVFEGDRFADFLLLWRLIHRSRLEAQGEQGPAGCWLEKWRTEAIASGTRALNQLRLGVEKALVTLGSGFISHQANAKLREKLHGSEVTVRDMHPALLHLVYRLLFLFVAEDRGLLIPDEAPAEARERYDKYFSTARLRRTATRRTGGPHGDQWHALNLVLKGLGAEGGRPELGLPGLGGLFERTEADKVLEGLELPNEALFKAIRALSVVVDPKLNRPRRVDYRHLGAEELGSIYESLLELVPRFNPAANTFELRTLAGNERKTTGSYYTPSSLIDCLLDSALDPVIDDAVKSGTTREEQEAALLRLTVCDPACGSGHFLVAAARRIAKRLASVRTDSPEPSAEDTRTALRDVISRCIYGVDLNPMAVELAKVSLWIESLEPGKPLSFLDAHVKHGNGLVGATPKLLADGLPDDAFKVIEGDDKTWVSGLRKRNLAERVSWEARQAGVHQGELFSSTTALTASNAKIAEAATNITNARNDELEYVHRQRDAYLKLTEGPDSEYVRERELADAWCAAFVWEKTKEARPPAPTLQGLLDLRESGWAKLPEGSRDKVEELREEYRFFHWHLEFPEVFSVPEEMQSSGAEVDERTGWAGGFSCVLGNPPWDKVDFEDKKYFSAVNPEIASTAGRARKELIKTWMMDRPELGKKYTAARRKVKATFHFASSSGYFPLCQQGLTVKGVNFLATDQLFAERFANLVSPRGKFGCVVPTAIATGAGAQYLFKDLVKRKSIGALYDFENRKPLFPGVDSRYNFCLLTAGGQKVEEPVARLAFALRDTDELNKIDRVFELRAEEITLVNPNTGNLPIFRTRRDAEITTSIYRHTPVLLNRNNPQGNVWGVTFRRLFDMTDDSNLFHPKESLERNGWERHRKAFERDGEVMLPLHEGRMGHQYSHRFADSINSQEASPDQLNDPWFTTEPEYWVSEAETRKRLSLRGVSGVALLGHRRVARSTDERTSIAALLPWGPASYGWIITAGPSTQRLLLLEAVFNSFVYDYLLRNSLSQPSVPQSTSEQLPVPRPEAFEQHTDFITSRVLELTYTAHDMTPLARELGDTGPPFRWHEERRLLMRAELDAMMFRLYGVQRTEVHHIMDTFDVARRKEISNYGTYRTKEAIIDIYDRMAEPESYATPLYPSPGSGPRHESHAQ